MSLPVEPEASSLRKTVEDIAILYSALEAERRDGPAAAAAAVPGHLERVPVTVVHAARVCDAAAPHGAACGKVDSCTARSLSFVGLQRESPACNAFRSSLLSSLEQRNLASTVARRAGCPLLSSAKALAASTPACGGQEPLSVPLSSSAPVHGKSRTLVPSADEAQAVEDREAAVRLQQQQLEQMLSPQTDDEEPPSGMSDEEFSQIAGIAPSASPRTVAMALSKWRQQNPKSELARRLHRKWMEVFEEGLLQDLTRREEATKGAKTWMASLQQIVLGGQPLSAAAADDVPDAPSELDQKYTESQGLPEAFRTLAMEVREEQEAAQRHQSFFHRLSSPAKYFLPLLAVSSVVQRAALTAVFAAGGIAGRLMTGKPPRRSAPSQTNTVPADRRSLRAMCLSAVALGAHALLGVASAFCSWKVGLVPWISFRSQATGAVIAQWWLASALYRFQSPVQRPCDTASGSDRSGLPEAPGTLPPDDPLQDALNEGGDGVEEGPIVVDGREGKEWFYDDPEFPTAFREDD
ncbi:hypothetical protein cyc_04107 [Cyclospora cayetanensis]|uniref:Uncharacterized protein n=1 Tax=Cyclospora cayetanensis TaxID=88456 RepID=A0A1D3D6H6_9EIME|nr:hypothetical protein cyc_04107 [Cyclospora cayetanensis]